MCLFTHTAQAGDSLVRVANRYLIKPAEWQILLKYNAVRDPRQLAVGTLIKIPVAAMRVDPAPTVTKLPTQFEKPGVRFVFPALPGAVSYRAQIAFDNAFTNLVANATSASPDAAFVNLPDHTLFLRVRGVDVNGQEDKDATHIFSVNARPLPPTLVQPRDKSLLSGDKVTLVWLPSPDAVVYRVQVGADVSFLKLLVDQNGVAGVTLTPAATLKPASYLWRVASFNTKNEPGPWNEVQSFTVPSSAPVINATRVRGEMSLEIGGSTAQSHQVQIVRDEKFTNLVSDRVLAGNKFELGALAANAYYVRVRTNTDAG